LFKVEAVDWEAPEPGGFDGLLLTSANAIRHGGEAVQQLRALKAYCVGEATAEAARAAGFDIAASGDRGVERLLGSIEPGRKLLHLAGEHRTEFDASSHSLTCITVYRSAALPAPDLTGVEGNIVLLHSARAAGRFAELTEGLDRSTIALAAISEAVAHAAGQGWRDVQAARSPDDSALLALARAMCDKRR
jgi:uroporphyrinogen-III synthase